MAEVSDRDGQDPEGVHQEAARKLTKLPNRQSARCGDTVEDVNRSVTGRCTRTAAALRGRGRTRNEVIAARVAASCPLARWEALWRKRFDFSCRLIEDSHQSVSADIFR